MDFFPKILDSFLIFTNVGQKSWTFGLVVFYQDFKTVGRYGFHQDFVCFDSIS